MARPSSRTGTKQEFRSLIFPSGMTIESEIKIRESETPAQRTHRHRMEVRRFWIEEAPIHLLAVGTRPGSMVDDKKWAFGVLSHLLIAVAGFAFGKAAK
jgi:hypothetical protein